MDGATKQERAIEGTERATMLGSILEGPRSIGEITERIVRRLRMVDGESRATTPRVEEDANKGRPRAHR